MRYHIKVNDSVVFVGFQAKNYRFVFYTHGKMNTVNDWYNFIKKNNYQIYDENGNSMYLDEFEKFVDHLQYHSNAAFVNNYKVSNDGYNFSDNGTRTKF